MDPEDKRPRRSKKRTRQDKARWLHSRGQLVPGCTCSSCHRRKVSKCETLSDALQVDGCWSLDQLMAVMGDCGVCNTSHGYMRTRRTRGIASIRNKGTDAARAESLVSRACDKCVREFYSILGWKG